MAISNKRDFLYNQKSLTWRVFFGISLSFLAISPQFNLEPVNLPKFLCLQIFAFSLIPFMIIEKIKISTLLKIMFATFLTLMVLSVLFTDQITTLEIFGNYGRSTGFLTYFALSLVSLFFVTYGSLLHEKILTGLYFMLFGVSTFYGLFQYLKFDPVPWNNKYSPIIGFFGNPDFMSAILGIFVSIAIPYMLKSKESINQRSILFLISFVATFLIYKSNAQQGLIVIAISILFYALINVFIKKNAILSISVFSIFTLLSFTAILGMLKIGPFARILYQESITYRGYYWHSAIKTIFQHPFLGVGADSFGDWYRTNRSYAAFTGLDPNVFTNAAHNVYFDVALNFGIPAALLFLMYLLYGVYSGLRLIIREKNDLISLGLLLGLIAYMAQALISLNMISLALIGVLLPGMLISRWRNLSKNDLNKSNISKSSAVIHKNRLQLMFPFAIVGIAVGILPFKNDAEFRHAYEMKNLVQMVEKANQWPQDPTRYGYMATFFAGNNRQADADKMFRKAIEIDNRYFLAYKYLSKSQIISNKERIYLQRKLHQLDPYGFK